MFWKRISSAAAEVLGEGLFELPWMLLSECDSIEGAVCGVIFALVLGGILVFLLVIMTVVSEVFSSSSF